MKQRRPKTLSPNFSDTSGTQQGGNNLGEADGYPADPAPERGTGEGSDSALARLKIIERDRAVPRPA